MLFTVLFLWSLIVIQTCGTFCLSVFTTRILNPESYGTVACSWFFFSFFGALTDFGLENAFVASLKDKNQDNQSFWTHLILRFSLAFLALPFGLLVLGITRLTLLLFLDFLVQKLSFTPKLYAEHNGTVKPLGAFETFTSIGAGAVTLLLARENYGALSLVLGSLLRNTGNFALYFWASGMDKFSLPHLTIAQTFFSNFGFHGTLSSIIGLLTYDFMPFAIGKFGSLTQAGLYSRSFSLATAPLLLCFAFSRLSTSIWCNAQGNRKILREQLAKMQIFKLAFIVPAQIFLIIFAPQIFALLFKHHWSAAVPIYRVLCLYTCARIFYDDVTNVLSVGLEKPKYLTISQSVQSSIIFSATFLLVLFKACLTALWASVIASVAMFCATTFFWITIARELNFFSMEIIHFYYKSIAQLLSGLKQKITRVCFMNSNKENTKSKKILFVSQFSQSSNNYCYADFFVKLAHGAQFNVKTLDCKYNYFQLGPKSSDLLPWPLKQFCNLIANLKLIFQFIKHKPDLVFLIKGENIWYKTLKLLKLVFKFKLVNFYPDSPFSFHNGNSNSNVLLSLGLYDRFAIWSKTLAQVLVASGCKEVFYWPFLCDKNIFKPLGNDYQTETEKKFFHSDVCFVGTWDKKREEFLTSLAKTVKNLNLKVWGESWLSNVPQSSPLHPCLKGSALAPMAMSKAFAGAKIVLNFLKEQNLASHNMRTFEVVSTNAFLLTERSSAHSQELFTEDESVACFASKEELAFKVVKYLEEAETRHKIAKAGRERIDKIADSEALFNNLLSF